MPQNKGSGNSSKENGLLPLKSGLLSEFPLFTPNALVFWYCVSGKRVNNSQIAAPAALENSTEKPEVHHDYGNRNKKQH